MPNNEGEAEKFRDWVTDIKTCNEEQNAVINAKCSAKCSDVCAHKLNNSHYF